jgi:hypothetical protein
MRLRVEKPRKMYSAVGIFRTITFSVNASRLSLVHHSLLSIVTGLSLSRDKASRDVQLDIYCHLVPRLRVRGVTPPKHAICLWPDACVGKRRNSRYIFYTSLITNLSGCRQHDARYHQL